MSSWLKRLFWILISLLGGMNSSATAATCLRLTGVIQDYASRLPLMAKLYVETQQGRFELGVSAAQTGQFTVEVNCPATALIIEKAGYRSQTLLLNTTSSLSTK